MVGAGLLLVVSVRSSLPVTAAPALVAYALLVTAVVFAAATISNDNLQDLKTGQLVDATPWRQQVALIVGVGAGAAIIPPVLDLLNHAYGFAGAPGVDAARALAAPQAALISTLARGVIQGNLDWSLIGSGVLIGVGLDPGRRNPTAQHPGVAAATGRWTGNLSAHIHHTDGRGRSRGRLGLRPARRSQRQSGRRAPLGVLLASGMIVGESLVGVVLAAVVVFSGRAAPLALVGDAFAGGPPGSEASPLRSP